MIGSSAAVEQNNAKAMRQLCAYIRGEEEGNVVALKKIALGSAPYTSPMVLQSLPDLLQALQEVGRNRPSVAANDDPKIDAETCGSNNQNTIPKALCGIETVQIRENLVQDLSRDQLEDLVEHLGHLPQLKQLEVCDVMTTMAPPRRGQPQQQQQRRPKVHSLSLATLLQRCRTLETLMIWPLTPISPRCLAPLEAALTGHPALRSLHWLNLVTPGTGSDAYDPTFDLTRLVRALATVPNLQHLQWAPGFSLDVGVGLLSQPSAARALHHLVQTAPRLQSLSLRNVGLTLEHVEAMIEGMLPNHNGGGLQHLDIRYNPRFSVQDAYQRFANLLQDTSRRRAACTLQYLDLVDDNDTKSSTNKSNSTMVEFYLALNRVGRGTFLYNDQASYRAKAQVLVACQGDVQLLFYLLQRNPSFLAQVGGEVTR